MATRKKQTPAIEFDPRLVAAGLDVADLEKMKREGYVSVYVYETKALALDEWQQAYFPMRSNEIDRSKQSMEEAVRQGRARKVELIGL